MKAFKRAAQIALQRTYGGSPYRHPQIGRVSVEIELDGRRETVSLWLGSDALSSSCTCEKPACEHTHAARSRPRVYVSSHARGSSIGASGPCP